MKVQLEECRTLQGKKQNWLITSASAKVDLVQRMRAAVHAHGGMLYVSDMDPLSAAFHVADGFRVLPPLKSEDYAEELERFCSEHDIGVILPTRDADVAYFAASKSRLASDGIVVIVSDAATVGLCLDKVAFHEHCIAVGLPVLPRVAKVDEMVFPCFVRSRVGAGGVGAQRVDAASQFALLYQDADFENLLIQPWVDMPEYTIDILFGADGAPVQWIVRERLRVKRGETCVGVTVDIPAFDEIVRMLGAHGLFLGPVTLQCFYTPESGPYVIEVNPRIGGGAALGIEAGLDTPARLVQLVQGEAEAYAQPRPLRYGLKMFRYSTDLFVS